MDELWLWTQAYLDGELPDADAARLAARLEADPAALAWFVETCRLHENLGQQLAGARTDRVVADWMNSLETNASVSGDEQARERVAPAKATTWTRRLARRVLAYPRPVSLSVAIAFNLLVICALAYFMVPTYRRWAQGPAEPPQPIATLAEVRQATWGSATPRLARGARLFTQQRLELTAGAVEIAYDSGASLKLVAPTTLVLASPPPLDDGTASAGRASPGGAALERGRIVVRAPRAARGFTVNTPDAELVDLGTEFGVEVTPGQNTQVHVLEGSVAARLRSGRALAAATTLTAGQAYRFAANASPSPISFQANLFAAAEALDLPPPTDPYGAAVVGDDPLAFYRFSVNHGFVANMAPRAESARQHAGRFCGVRGKMPWAHGPRSSELPGIAAESAALDFQAREYIEIADSQPLRITGAITLEAWVNPRDIIGGQRGIVAKYFGRNEQRGYDLLLEQEGRRGQFIISADGTFNDKAGLTGNTQVPADRWTHIAATFTPGERMCLYLNGQLDAELTTGVPSKIFPNNGPLWIGCQWHPSDPINLFQGRIADVAIYDRALSGDEIRAHYAAATAAQR